MNDKIFSVENSNNRASTSSTVSRAPLDPNLTPLQRRRAELLAQKAVAGGDATNNAAGANDTNNNHTFRSKIIAELEILHAATLKVPADINPSAWYKENCKRIPLLSRYWMAYSAFPATSCSAERILNVDGLILTDLR